MRAEVIGERDMIKEKMEKRNDGKTKKFHKVYSRHGASRFGHRQRRLGRRWPPDC